jgi:uncharacterized alpha-E superfamily protein
VDGADGWNVRPGGLTRVSSSRDSLVVSSQRGGESKDTWVLADAPTSYMSLLPQNLRPGDPSRSSFALTSRVADNLLWLGRESERVEASVRLFRAALSALVDEPLRSADAAIPDSIAILERLGLVPTERVSKGDAIEERVLAGLFDRSVTTSVAANVSEAHRLAWLLRDRISADSWSVLSRLDQDFVTPGVHPALRVSGALQLLDRTLLRIAAFTGLVVESMTRGMGWQFLEVGRRIERGIQIVALLQQTVVEELPEGSRRLDTLLSAADSVMTYRSRYQTPVQLPLVLDLLLVDELNPRSLAFQLVGLEERFRNLHHAPHEALQTLLVRVREARLDDLMSLVPMPGGASRRLGLEVLLRELAEGLPALADSLNHAYLSHAQQRRRVAGFRPRDPEGGAAE